MYARCQCSVSGSRNGTGVDEVRREHVEQQRALAQRLAHQPEVALLEVAQPAVDELARARDEVPGGEVARLDQRDVQPARGGVQRAARAGRAAADHDDVEDLVGHALERRAALIGPEHWISSLTSVRAAMADYIGAIDQGTTSSRFIVFDRDGRIVAVRPARARADHPEGGLGRARRQGGLAAHARGDRRRAGQLRPRGGRHRRGRHHQPARDDGRLGPRDRRADPQRDRLAGHAHRRDRARARRRRPAARRSPGCRSRPTSAGRRSSGSWTTSTAPASARRTASSRSGRWTPGCCGT